MKDERNGPATRTGTVEGRASLPSKIAKARQVFFFFFVSQGEREKATTRESTREIDLPVNSDEAPKYVSFIRSLLFQGEKQQVN